MSESEFKQNSLAYNGNIIRLIKNNWVIFIFIGTLIVGWTTIQRDLEESQKDIVRLEALAQANSAGLNELRVVNSEILAVLRELRDRLDRQGL